MARSVGTSVENAFTRGLITEVTGVNSPENSVTETINVSYDRRGRAIKRMGFDYEVGHTLFDVEADVTYAEYLWETVSDNTSLDFVVLQVGTRVYFYESTLGQSALSVGLKPFFVDLLGYKTTEASVDSVANTSISCSSGKGYLFIAHPFCETLRISYNSDTDTITENIVTIEIRDFEGVEDGYGIDERRNSLSNEHKYNLFNQGWYATAQLNESEVNGSVFDRWDGDRSDYPSHKDVWWYYLDVDDQGSVTGQEWFNTMLIDAYGDLYGNTPAAKGHYIYPALYIDRSAVSGISGIPVQTSNGQRPSVVAFYSGRAFYAGVGKSGYSQNIYFSQIVQDDNQFGRCYQKNDPTSRDLSDLLDDDGGVIKIPDMNTVYDLKVVGESIVVLASNGIWSISGTDNGPFRATDYTVSRLSTFPAINRTTVGLISGTPIWWNYEGIYTLQNNEIGLTREVTSLTAQSIQSFYDEIPPRCKAQAKGYFNDQEGLMYWLYSEDSLNPSNFDHILILDVVSGAFYVYTLPDQGPSIKGIIAVRTIRTELTDDFVVTSSNDSVVTSTNDPIIITQVSSIEVSNKIFKFVTAEPAGISFAEIRSSLFLDWSEYPYESYFITGYKVRGEIIRRSQTNYLAVMSEADSGSSCYVQGLWDYSSDSQSGRFSNPQQVYRSIEHTKYVRSRVKIRGNGYALQFKFFGEDGKPFTIIGWAGYDSVSGGP